MSSVRFPPGEASYRFSKRIPRSMSVPPEDCKRFLSALLWITKEDATWRAVPKVYGYWNTIYHRFGRWCDAGVFEALPEHFHETGEISAILVDSTMVRAHSCVAGAPKKKADKTQRASDEAGVALRRN